MRKSVRTVKTAKMVIAQVVKCCVKKHVVVRTVSKRCFCGLDLLFQTLCALSRARDASLASRQWAWALAPAYRGENAESRRSWLRPPQN